MNFPVRNSRLVLAAMLVVLITALDGCSKQVPFAEKDFVGKWSSTRATTPVHLYGNGEWELMANDGRVMQYGVWQISGNKMMWSVIIDHHIQHDTNAVLSVTEQEFRLREQDGSITTFSRLDLAK